MLTEGDSERQNKSLVIGNLLLHVCMRLVVIKTLLKCLLEHIYTLLTQLYCKYDVNTM